jgi:hypothetical protein
MPMLRAFALLAGLFLAAGAQACPQVTSKTGALYFSARELREPLVARVRAGGTVVLDACAEVPGSGHVPFAPTAVIDFSADLRGRGLLLRTEGACDAVLLVRTARGNWYFDDDNGGGGNAELVLGNPAGGRYRVWVGSHDAFGCDAELALRTVRASPRLSR